MTKQSMKCALCAAGFLPLSCAANPAPRELVDARAVYVRAAAGDAAKFAPGALDDARIALVAAELPYREGEPAYLIRDRAYLAVRAAELAQVLASTKRAREEHARAPGSAADVRERLTEAERQLEQSEEPPGVANGAAREEPPPARGTSTSALSVGDEPRGTVITVPATALFPPDTADFLPGAKDRLKPVAEALSDDRGIPVVVETRTDSVGADVDAGLSLRRADHVRDFLVSHDVEPERVVVAEPDQSGASGTETEPMTQPGVRPTIIVRLKTPSP